MEKLKKIFSTEEIPAIDQYTIEHEPIKSIDLMERAAAIWTEYLLKKFSEFKKIVVVVGGGNNGGDGLAIARLLRQKGFDVAVFCFPEIKRSGDCEINYSRWQGKTIEVNRPEDFDPEPDALIIDAIFGSGLNRKVTGLFAGIIRKINNLPNLVVAVDIPSGLMGEDNGDNDTDTIVRAKYTFTFQFPKLAFMFAENYPFVGEWRVLDIGLHPGIINCKQTKNYYLTIESVAQLMPVAGKFAHKGTNGHGLLIAGAYGMMGAAVLAAKAAVRSGIGLLSCHVPEKGLGIIQTAVPEALIDIDRSDSVFSEVKELERFNAVAVGPGIGRDNRTAEGLEKLLREWRGVTVLDADALNIISNDSRLLDLLHEGCILTPHPKELERLIGKSRNDFERLNKLSTFANHYKVCVVLKGAHTVIVSPAGEHYFNMSGNPGMAKGGAGDVLTGMILALATNGIPPLIAAIIGVFAHGLTGDMLAGECGERGISAGKMAQEVGYAWNELEKIKKRHLIN